LKLEYLLQAKVWTILKELSWGDRFERDLQEKITDIEDGPESFADIRDRLTEMGLVYQLKGGEGSPYLALTYKGQEVVGRLIKTEEILDSEESQ
jgi:hypothetical protein